jgi:PBP1b-binding outer membrane lipoprotein LpoB
MLQKLILSTIISALFLSACATRPDSIKADVISANRYGKYDCEDLNEGVNELMDREKKLSDQMTSTANKQIGLNVLGGVLMATTGFGYARTVNNESYGLALGKVRGHLSAMREQAKNINCEVPQATEAAK